ncbi:MAG TPA: glycosyltransferase family 1 protein [Candidatus Saccharimonadales bacterium]|nr:glycosyltransferase family 1 protein [Candidatus Saccharimonadales bacterium]
MRILFLTIDAEENMRGIGSILKSLMRAARAEGHEVGLLTGIPYKHAYEGDSELQAKIEHVHLQHYLLEGRKSFKYMIPGGYRKKNLLKKMLSLSFLDHAFMPVQPELLSGKRTLAYDMDFIVRAPFVYQFIARNKARISRKVVGRIARSYDIDLVFAVSPTVLRSKDLGRKTKLATFVHDIMPLETLETPADNDTPARFARQVETAVKNSDLLMANSKSTADKVMRFAPKVDIDVVYGVVSSAKTEIIDSAILQIRNLRPNHYLLFASAVEKRKNLEGLFEAYALAFDHIRMPLVIVGAPGYGFEEIVDKYESLPDHIRENILFTGYASEDDKFTLFKHAHAFVFPSFTEGLGVQNIEAMSYGIPVLSTNVDAIPEVAGDAALLVNNPYDVHEIADALVRICNDEALRKKLIEAGMHKYQNFTFEKFQQRVGHSLNRLGKR